MSNGKQDSLGDVVKELEALFERRVAEPGQFLMARADGRAFHTFTRDFDKPYDERMSEAMMHTAQQLCHGFNARLSYTQSDEITLCFYYSLSSATDYPFGARLQKLCSLIAAQATALFNQAIYQLAPTKAIELPIFDCRVFMCSTLETAVNTFIWREKDARKNAVSMAASTICAPKALLGVSTTDRLKLLQDAGIIFDEYPLHFSRGVYFHRQERRVLLDPATLSKIPTNKVPADGAVTRRAVEIAKFTSLSELSLEEQRALFGVDQVI